MLTPRSPSSSASAVPREDLVEFGHLLGVEVLKGQDGSQVLHKPAELGCRWNASAASTHPIAGASVSRPGPRGIAFVPTRLPSSGGYVIGLASAAGIRHQDLMGDQGLASLDYAVHVVSRGGLVGSSATLDVRELGCHQGTFGTFACGDKVEVVLNAQGRVEYRVNSQVRHISEQIPEYPLHVKCCACAPGNIVRDVRWVGPGLLQAAHQHLAQEERHQRQLDHVEERLEEVAARCQATDEQAEHRFQECDAAQQSHAQQLAALEARFGEMAERLQRTEEHYKQLLQTTERRLEVTAEERDASRKQVEEMEERLESAEAGRLRQDLAEHLAEHLAGARRQLAEHSEELRGQLGASEARHAASARRAGEAGEELAGRLRAQEAALAAAEEGALQRLRAGAGALEGAQGERLRASEAELARLHRALANEHLGASERRLRASEAELERVHRALANEHLGASERRLRELQRGLSAELEEGLRRQLLEATERARGEPEPPAPPPRPPPQPEGPPQEGPAQEALKERLKQLAAIEERMRLPSPQKSPAAPPANAVDEVTA